MTKPHWKNQKKFFAFVIRKTYLFKIDTHNIQNKWENSDKIDLMIRDTRVPIVSKGLTGFLENGSNDFDNFFHEDRESL